jgi:hypothetical protein
MLMVERATVRKGKIVLDRPVPLPDGAIVTIWLEADEGEAPTAAPPDDIRDLPFFGMWAGRRDMVDSVAWVNRQRDDWRGVDGA